MAPLTVDRTYVAENAVELRRLRAMVERLSDADLARPTPGGWTVASSLAHVAFWDQRILFWLDRWERGETPRRLEEADVDWINDAGKPPLPRAPAAGRGPADRRDRRGGRPAAGRAQRRPDLLEPGGGRAALPRPRRTTARRTSTRSSACSGSAASKPPDRHRNGGRSA